MANIALIGDASVKHYRVIERLWELASVVADVKIHFELVGLKTAQEVSGFLTAFKQESLLRGFGVASPWRQLVAQSVDRLEASLPTVNVVYKDDHGLTVGADTNPHAMQRAIELTFNLYKCNSVLVIGAGDMGLPIAQHVCTVLGKQTYVYEPAVQSAARESMNQDLLAPDELIYHASASAVGSRQPMPQGVVGLASLSGVASRQYDLIINTTPLGRLQLNQSLGVFTSPLDMTTLRAITHPDTIVQEMNYLPAKTLLLEMAQQLGLRIVGGDLALVLRTNENLQQFFGIELSTHKIMMLVEEIGAFIGEQ